MLLRFSLLTIVPLILLAPLIAGAQGVSLSVTPTLIEMAAEPGQSWESGIKVINNNPFPLTVYASVVDFAPAGEAGQGNFLPVSDTAEGQELTLAQWVRVPSEAIVIPSDDSVSVPLQLAVPESANPGGHYAAILIGTQPPETGGTVRTSQMVTSLFFVRIAGEVVESGNIRSFRALDQRVGEPAVDFELRFENTGNVHLRPQGDIIIKNMWGTERGVIPINRQGHFGNVLPDSIRRFEFSWRGAYTLADIGRYTAEVTLAYGEDGRKFVSRSATFWVIPLRELFLVLGFLVVAGLFIRAIIRSYVRRMLVLAGVDPDVGRTVPVSRPRISGADVRIERRAFAAPVTSGYRDLKSRLATPGKFSKKFVAVWEFVSAYRWFFVSLCGVILLVVGLYVYFNTAFNATLPYEVTFRNSGQETTVSSDQLEYEAEQRPAGVSSETLIGSSTEQSFEIIISNVSGVSGAAAAVRTLIEQEGYQVAELGSDLDRTSERSVIVYTPDLAEQALELSRLLDNAPVSAAMADEGSDDRRIEIFVGSDLSLE